MVMLETETRGTPDMSPLSPVVTPSPSPAPSPGMSELPEVRITESEDVFELAEIETSRFYLYLSILVISKEKHDIDMLIYSFSV